MTDRHKAALVTGGGTGIGAATARRLARDGYDVIVTGRRPGPIEAVADEVGGVAVAADVSTPEGAASAVDAAVERGGGLDALVLNAGVGAPGSLLDLEPAAFEDAIRVNLTGAFLTARAAIPRLLERRGAIVAVSSVAGLRASPASLAYCVSKAGLAMLTQCIALDHGPQGVRANCVCPGWTRTPMADGELDELAASLSTDREGAYAAVVRDVPLGRAATAEEIAETIAWLLSPAAAYVNGAVIPVDGGSVVVDIATTAFREVLA